MGDKSKVEFSDAKPNSSWAQVQDISPHSLLNKKDLVHVVDVRRPDEFTGELGHIPGAQLLTLEILPQQLLKLPKDETVVFVCRSGGRSAQAAAFAQESGFQSVFNLQGGMLLWNELNMGVEGKNL